jgi:dihydroflavonol-4-reductase
MTNKVLLTGATGFLGQHILRELIAEGFHVRALSRSDQADSQLRAIGAEPVRADMQNASSLSAAVQGVDYVVHTAADTSMWRANNEAQTRTNVEGTKALLAAARDANVKGFLHTSSVSAYSHLCHETLHENLPQRGGDSWVNYERTKFFSEKAVRESGLPFMIFQPSHVFGPGDTNNWSRLIRLIDQNKLPGAPPGAGAFADVREIAKAQVRALQQPHWGQAFLLGGEQASFVDLIAMIGRSLNRPTPKKPIPAAFLRVYAHALGLWSRITGKQPEITPESAAITCHRLHVDSSKAERDLHYRATPLPELLSDTINWMRANKMLS